MRSNHPDSMKSEFYSYISSIPNEPIYGHYTLPCKKESSDLNPNGKPGGCPISELYPSKLTKAYQKRPNVTHSGVLCHNWAQYGKCFYWGNCIYAHPIMEFFKARARSYYCPSVHSEFKCIYGSACPLAQSPKELIPSAEMERVTPRDTSHSTITLSGIVIPMRFVMKTDGFIRWTKANEREKSSGYYDLCRDERCDNWENCTSIHLHRDYWLHVGSTSLPPHAYLRHLLPTPTANTMMPTMPPITAKAESDPISSSSSIKQEPQRTDGLTNQAPPVRDEASYPASTSTKPSAAATQPIVPTQTSPEVAHAERKSDGPVEYELIEEESLTMAHDISPYLVPPAAAPLSEDAVRANQITRPLSMGNRWIPCSKRYEAWLQRMVESGQFCAISEDMSVGAPRYLYHPNVVIGRGGASVVYLGLQHEDGMEIALKRITTVCGRDDALDKGFQNEVDMLKTRNGMQGLVRYYGHVVVQRFDIVDHFIALELMECDLRTLVKSWDESMRSKPGHFLCCQYIVGSVLKTLGSLWQADKGVIHRDIKPDNILIDKWRNVKLIDFGISKELGRTRMTYTGHGGTSGYSTPEQKEGGKASVTSDVFSLGLVLYYVLTGREDWYDGSSVVTEKAGVIASAMPWRRKRAAALHLLKNLLHKDPKQRAWLSLLKSGVEEFHDNILRHPFFWSDERANAFLVGLGSLKSLSAKLLKAIEETIRRVIENEYGKRNWWEILDPQLWSAKQHQLQERNRDRPMQGSLTYTNNPRQLLRFIRNCYAHRDEPPRAEDAIFCEKPYFLELLPELVVELWQVCRRSKELINNPVLGSTLRSAYHPSLSNHDARADWF